MLYIFKLEQALTTKKSPIVYDIIPNITTNCLAKIVRWVGDCARNINHHLFKRSLMSSKHLETLICEILRHHHTLTWLHISYRWVLCKKHITIIINSHCVCMCFVYKRERRHPITVACVLNLRVLRRSIMCEVEMVNFKF